MKKLINKWILPVCLLLIIFTQLKDYYLQADFNPAMIVVVIALLPAALKGLEYKISKQLERVITICAAIGLIYIIFWDIFF